MLTTTQKRLWKMGGAVASVIVAILIANPILSPKGESVTGNMIGIDFTAFYSGGTLLREGRWAELYDLSAVYQSEQKLRFEYGLEMKTNVGPWWNPPFYAWVFEALSRLSFPVARDVWIGINFLCILGAIGLMIRWLPAGVTWRQWGLIPLLVLVSMPVVQCLTHGQNTGTSLLIVCLAVTCWRNSAKTQASGGWAIAAGACAGLLVYKPQLAVVLGAAVVVTVGRRALLGWLSAVCALLVVSEWTMPGMLGVYWQKLPGILHFMQVEKEYPWWGRHATIKAFWRLLIQGQKAGEQTWTVGALTVLCAGALAASLAGAIWKRRGDMGRFGDQLIVATIVTTPLLMPFYFDYDLLLVSAAAVLFAGDALRGGGGKIWPWVALYGVLFVNPGLSGHTRVNLAVPVLAVVAGMLIVRLWRQEREEVSSPAAMEPQALRPAA